MHFITKVALTSAATTAVLNFAVPFMSAELYKLLVP